MEKKRLNGTTTQENKTRAHHVWDQISCREGICAESCPTQRLSRLATSTLHSWTKLDTRQKDEMLEKRTDRDVEK